MKQTATVEELQTRLAAAGIKAEVKGVRVLAVKNTPLPQVLAALPLAANVRVKRIKDTIAIKVTGAAAKRTYNGAAVIQTLRQHYQVTGQRGTSGATIQKVSAVPKPEVEALFPDAENLRINQRGSFTDVEVFNPSGVDIVEMGRLPKHNDQPGQDYVIERRLPKEGSRPPRYNFLAGASVTLPNKGLFTREGNNAGMRMRMEDVESRLQTSGLQYAPISSHEFLVTLTPDQNGADPRELEALFPHAPNVSVMADYHRGGLVVSVQ